MKYSRQREAVYRAVQNARTHPTADEVYDLVRLQYPQISLGTVYRNLNQLTEMGMLQKIAMPVSSDRYDARTDEHYHMTCSACGRVVDLDGMALSQLDAEILQRTGFQVQNHHLVLEGLCWECGAKLAPSSQEQHTA